MWPPTAPAARRPTRPDAPTDHGPRRAPYDPAVARPDSLLVVIVVAVLLVVATVATLLLWNRMRGARAVRTAQRVGLLVLCQLLAVLTAAAVTNHVNQFFTTWSDLSGGLAPADAAGATVPELPGGNLAPSGSPTPASTAAALPEGFSRSADGFVRGHLTGTASGIEGEVVVALPAGWEPGRHGRYRVILGLAGYPGNPVDAIIGLHLASEVANRTAAGTLPPTIVVAATTNVGGKNWDCADITGGPQVATWLTRDVRELMVREFGADPDARWTAIGLSSGGYCAARLLLTEPRHFGTAISMSGSNAPDAPALTATAADRTAGDLRTLAGRGVTPPVSLLLTATAQDGATVKDAQALKAAAPQGVSVDVQVLPKGGHNWSVWGAMAGPAFDWLVGHQPS